jgi:hypothetical protein
VGQKMHILNICFCNFTAQRMQSRTSLSGRKFRWKIDWNLQQTRENKWQCGHWQQKYLRIAEIFSLQHPICLFYASQSWIIIEFFLYYSNCSFKCIFEPFKWYSWWQTTPNAWPHPFSCLTHRALMSMYF